MGRKLLGESPVRLTTYGAIALGVRQYWVIVAVLAFIMPSQYEGFGFSILEAMACRTPVATSNVSFLAEVGGEVAIYFDSTDNDSILAAFEPLAELHNNQQRTRAKTCETTLLA